MNSRFLSFLSGVALLAALGCEVKQGNPAGGGNATPILPGAPQAGAPPQSAPLGGPPAAAAPKVPAGQTALVAPGGAFPILLSAGTALPQSAPDGTVMSFSVDFQADSYLSQDAVRCVLVIQRGDGQRVEQPIQISARGTWVSVVPNWQPEEGPFQAHVEEIASQGTRKTVSTSVNLE
jgi:hypothetical protein